MNEKGVNKRLSKSAEEIMFKPSYPYITGAGYRHQCDFILDQWGEFDPDLIKQFDGMKIFLKTDMILYFVENFLPKINKQFILYSHNSDAPVSAHPWVLNLLNDDNLIIWHSQNVNIKHNKLRSIPIGLSNKMWKTGDVSIFEDIRENEIVKNNMFYCSFEIGTNKNERQKCLDSSGIEISPKVDFKTYIENISKSYFTICPEGNGIDTHRIWESLYVKTTPILLDNFNVKHYTNYPILILNRWEEFKNIDLSTELYDELWLNFDESKLFF
jgi:hypothetical protein